jgi:UDP:flavonoid glycosyltransferase YjiC (YdhE family)
VPAAGRDVLLVVGGGGHDLHATDVRAAAAATGRRWHVAGALRVPPGDGVVDHGPRADLAPLLRRSDVVVATAGMGAVADVAAARRPAVLLPQERPFDEQERHAAALEDAGLVTVLGRWPAAGRWRGVLDDARRRDPQRWSLLHDGRGAERLARVVHQAAGVRARPPVAVA